MRWGQVLERRRLRHRLLGDGADDDDFVQHAFLEILGRPVDIAARQHYVGALASGASRGSVVDTLAASEEAQARRETPRLPSLQREAPAHYRLVRTDDGVAVPVFTALDDADFAWLEAAILANRFYERPGIWNLEDDVDKEVMAELLASFGPSSVVELGCSSGTVLRHLVDAGIDAVGVDISDHARSLAPDHIRERIVLGDITSLDLGRSFDLAVGLDVFEHVRPARTGELIAGLARHLRPGGRLVANIPAYGPDPVFGEPFPMYLPSWRDDAAAGRPFRHLLVDAEGYPLHGHLVWATADWWVRRFAAHGFIREVAAEQRLQETFADHFAAAPARRSMFVFRLSDRR